MKVYSWKTLLVTVFGAGGLLVCSLAQTFRGSWAGVPWAILSAYYIVQGLRASLTEEGWRKDVETGEKGKRVYGAMFGRFAPVMRWGTVILMLVGMAFALALPQRPWLALAFLLGAVVYGGWLAWAFRRKMRQMGL